MFGHHVREAFGQKKRPRPGLVPNIIVDEGRLIEGYVNVSWCFAITVDGKVTD